MPYGAPSVFCALAFLACFGMGCGSDDKELKIALLLPQDEAPRYEALDRPAFERRIDEICSDCEVLYSNAAGDSAVQRAQAEAALRDDADVLVLDPVHTEYASAIVREADARGTPVVNYDSLVFGSKPNVFVSFGNVREGEAMAGALSDRLKQIHNRPHGPVVMINGEPGNRDQSQFEEGAKRMFRAAGVEIAKEYETPFWEATSAKEEMEHAIHALGRDGFAGVYAETDSLARGAIEAMKWAGIDAAAKPTTGREASIPGLQRILEGKQYMTLYEPVEREASASAEAAVALARGQSIPWQTITGRVENQAGKVPAILLDAVVVTSENARQALAEMREIQG